MKKLFKMQVKLFVAIVAILLLVQVPITYAANLSELKGQKSEIEKQKNELNSEIKAKSSEISTIESKLKELVAQIEALSAKITSTNAEITTVNAEIEDANNKIIALEEEIAILQEKIEQRDLLLQDRARAIQENGTVDYLDVLLGANSFVDFIDRFSAVNTLIEADRQIMREQQDDQNQLEEQKLVLENTRKELEDKKAELQRLKESLDSQKAEKDRYINELEAEQEKLKNEKQLLEEEYSEALILDKELDQKIKAETQRMLEELRKQNAGNLPNTSDGTFMKPTNGRLTSPWGWRNLGFGAEFHYGIDLANSTGTPIVASAGGIVTYAAPLSTYGNCIIITHSVNGQIFTTVYAHLSTIQVSKGQSVSKGEQIGLMGSTGRSTGPHLHFEIHTGPWNGQKAGNVNPLRYISL
ncbi:murein hydrolase activator EnvC family protein [Ureibacillus acetophenoni]|uniref:Murein DD-endopeptidase MepM/ murein hydrolase activator NlpD n=1 Tax=Ureibacillus acetophenoni TaxID=614649 RepID=A0A285TZB1_9BACL|nr:murein DD-endopeptidase MepM/ murein hydrolase activator NlpD [Ureibacillus acetophenoni]